MTTPTAVPETDALHAYEALAPFYDDFTSGYDHDRWLEGVQGEARRRGVLGGRALDLACGTGKSSAPLAAAGWDVWACDLSPGMVHAARARLGLGSDRCFVADLRSLPALEPFDLIVCLDDALNYLLSDTALRTALASAASVLAPGGVLVFDLNTLRTYGTVFATEFERTGRIGRYRWRGQGDGSAQPGARFAAQLDIGERVAGTHRQRHHPRGCVERAARAAGLTILGCRGQTAGAQLHDHLDEHRHDKALYVLAHTDRKGVTQ